MSEKQALDPYLPSFEYVADGEPHVFDGRVHIYGSHDSFGGKNFCEKDYVCWSAPVDDLSGWKYEGVIYHKNQDTKNKNGKNDVMFDLHGEAAASILLHDSSEYSEYSAPPKHRAKIFSFVKCVSTLGLMLVPLLRRTFMTDASEWRMVYLVPAILGIIVSFIALISLRETVTGKEWN